MPRENEPQLPAIVTVSTMARAIGMSRSRFYQLLSEGVFPEPSRHPRTGRPYYDREQQQKVWEVKRSCTGLNGKLVMFYDRQRPTPPPVRPTTRRPRCDLRRREINDPRPAPARPDPVLDELKHGLRQLGLRDATDAQITAALASEYPDGWKDVDHATLLRAVFRRLRCPG